MRYAVLLIGLCLLVCGCGSDDPASPQDTLAQGLQGHYSFSGTAEDSSPNGNDGTLLGNATVNGTLATGNNDTDALSLPASLLHGLQDFSIAGWVRFDGFHIWPSQWISGATAQEDNNLGIWYDPNNHRWSMDLFGNTANFAGNSVMEDQNWHHVAVTREGASARLYVDGAMVGSSVSVSGNPLEVDSGGFIVGQDQDTLGGGFSTDNSLSGEVDELRIYDRALIASEASKLHGLGR